MRPPRNSEPLNVSDLGGESREGFQTGQLANRLERYAKAREGALQFRDYLKDKGEPKLFDALSTCGSYAVYRDYFTIGQVRLSGICTCKKHLVCPLCAIRRGARALRLYSARMDALMASDGLLRPYLIGLTVANGPDLAERYKHLSGSLRKYHKRRMGARQVGEIRKAHSAVWSYETTNRGNGWHPHVHAVWLCREAPDPFALSREWHDITGDSYIVDVTPMRKDSDGSYTSAFCEVFKYAIKFNDLEFADRLHAHKTLKKKRLQDSLGGFRGLDVDATPTADDLLSDLPYIERFFTFVRGIGYCETGGTGEVFQHAA